MNEDEFVSTLQTGLKNSYCKAILFSEKQNKVIETEYLITVCVANALVDNNVGVGSPYKIILECPTKTFSKSCFPKILQSKKIIRRSDKEHNTERNGKIDIVVFKDEVTSICDDRSAFAAIEIKGFNKSKQTILEDLKRNTEYFKFVDDNVGVSRIKYTAFVAMQYYAPNDDKNYEKQKNKLTRKYEKYISELGLKDIEYTISVNCVSKSLLRDSASQDEYEDFIENKHLFFGVVVLFKKAKRDRNPFLSLLDKPGLIISGR